MHVTCTRFRIGPPPLSLLFFPSFLLGVKLGVLGGKPPPNTERNPDMHAYMVYTNLASHPGPGYKANANHPVLPLCAELYRKSALTAMIVSKTISSLVLLFNAFPKGSQTDDHYEQVPMNNWPNEINCTDIIKTAPNVVYGVSPDGIETTPNVVYGVSPDGIETTPNVVYGVSADGIEAIPNMVYGVSTDGIQNLLVYICHYYGGYS